MPLFSKKIILRCSACSVKDLDLDEPRFAKAINGRAITAISSIFYCHKTQLFQVKIISECKIINKKKEKETQPNRNKSQNNKIKKTN